MDRNIQRVGLINWLLLLASGITVAAVSRYANAATGEAAVVFLIIGFLVSLVSYFQMRLRTSEQLEKLDYDELIKAKGASTLFAGGDGESFPAQKSREQFDRWMVPIFTVLLFFIQAGAAYWVWSRVNTATPSAIDKSSVAMAVFAMLSLALFMFGRYSANLARLGGSLLVRPSSGYMLLSSAICFAGALTQVAVWFRLPKADIYTARALCIVLALAALESVIGLILEMYRPRVRGQAERLLYESRLIGLLGQPAGLFKTAAHALDYQFGFKVSETWFYQFLERALAWIILAQVSLLMLSTTIVIIDPDEQALLERLGNPVAGREILKPGLHLKLPWPIDDIHRFPTERVQTFSVGFESDPEKERDRVLVWTRAHYREEVPFLVASRSQIDPTTLSAGDQAIPVNLLTASIPVQYVISDLKAWAYGHANPTNLVERIATREIVTFLASVDMDEIMSSGRLQAAQELQKRIQTQANLAQLGVQILFVGLQDIHPPIGTKTVQVAGAYEAVIGAIQEKEARILAAEGYRLATVPRANAEAAKLISEAQAYRIQKIAGAGAQAGRFTNQLSAYKASPTVYLQRTYLDTMAKAVASPRKYVLATTNTEDVILMNLEDKLRPDLLDVPVAMPPSAKK